MPRSRSESWALAAVTNARQADDATGPDDGHRLGDDLPDAGALQDNVRLQSRCLVTLQEW